MKSEKQKIHLERLKIFHTGRKRSKETKEKISKSLLGKTLGRKRPEHSAWMKKNFKSPMTGKKHSAETKKKMSESWCYEKIMTPERNKKISDALKGNKNWNWRGGSQVPKDVKNRIRKSREYKHWRNVVFARDDYRCQECGLKSGKGKTVYLEAHHIKSFSFFPELRFEINNGLTLCRNCHLLTL